MTKNNKLEISDGLLLKQSCEVHLGVLEMNFLCQSIGSLLTKKPLSVHEDATMEEVIHILQNHKIGCIMVVDRKGTLVGIFSERDCILKVVGKIDSLASHKVSEFMVRDPVSQTAEATIAFALNLMSHGGFRHLPIVDDENIPIGMISVKDVVDYIVESYTSKLLAFDEG